MGKKSRREREKTGKAAPSERAFVANSLAGLDSADGQRVAAAKSALPNWETDDECIRALKAAGFHYAQYTVDFPTSVFCEELQSFLGRSRKVIDCTDLVPKGPGGDHHVLPREIHKHVVDSNRDDSYFLFVRTCHNNAAFLAGVRVYLQAAMLSSVGVDEYLKRLDSPTPSALVIERGGCNLVPAQALTSVHTAGRMVAALIKKRPEMALCAICGQSFFSLSETSDDVERISMAIAGPCRHLMHEKCLKLALSSKGDVAKQCQTCGEPLPLALIPQRYRESLTLTKGGGKKFAVGDDNLFQ